MRVWVRCWAAQAKGEDGGGGGGGGDVRGFGTGRSRMKGCSVAGEGSVGLVLCESRHVVRRAKWWV